MSTRAIYTFTDGKETHHVYKHHDGYPTEAAKFILAALPLAWPLPRFEPDEFAAAFVAANKNRPGGVRLCESGIFAEIAPLDVEYHYVVRRHFHTLRVFAYSIEGKNCDEHLIFDGAPEQFLAWANAQKAA